MAKEETLEFEGAVTDVLPDARFRVKLDNDHEIIAYTAGKMKKFLARNIELLAIHGARSVNDCETEKCGLSVRRRREILGH